MPEDADAEKVTAQMEAGVLTIRIGKPEKARPRRIEITATGNYMDLHTYDATMIQASAKVSC
ncbi:MAG: Hsp20 family protein [Phycisphaerales bacterium]|nr:MAG: Hsp20 family protein [Phycisphaerales bacterium]